VPQRQFLDAYRQRPTIASGARRATVHRASLYRWLADAAFADAMGAAFEIYLRKHPARVMVEESARQRWREKRQRARRPMRCYYLAGAGPRNAGDASGRATKQRAPNGSCATAMPAGMSGKNRSNFVGCRPRSRKWASPRLGCFFTMDLVLSDCAEVEPPRPVT
jgi:hypothetical protein